MKKAYSFETAVPESAHKKLDNNMVTYSARLAYYQIMPDGTERRITKYVGLYATPQEAKAAAQIFRDTGTRPPVVRNRRVPKVRGTSIICRKTKRSGVRYIVQTLSVEDRTHIGSFLTRPEAEEAAKKYEETGERSLKTAGWKKERSDKASAARKWPNRKHPKKIQTETERRTRTAIQAPKKTVCVKEPPIHTAAPTQQRQHPSKLTGFALMQAIGRDEYREWMKGA